MTKAEIDQLGVRLRDAIEITAEMRIELEQYRASFQDFSKQLTSDITDVIGISISERPGKSTPSIVAKLKRGASKLSNMRDIAGGRVVIANLLEQQQTVGLVLERFPTAKVINRNESPVYGYHAVHLEIKRDGLSYELQVRTTIQDLWAQLSEKCADKYGFGIKYGKGPENLIELLTASGNVAYLTEVLREKLTDLMAREDELKQRTPGYTGIPGMADAIRGQEEAESRLHQLLAIMSDQVG